MTILGYGVAALVGILLTAALAVPGSRALGIPLSVALAGIGLAYGFFTSILGYELAGGLLDTYDQWFVAQLALDSNSMLTALLPPLLFEMALAVNLRRLLDDVATILVMAILAVIAATAAVGLALWGVSDIDIVACLLLGAAVATTDPGAVITTFKEIGAPRRLLVILEGESLLNDAAAIAVFSLLIGVLSGVADVSALGLVGSFLYSFCAGAVIGIVVALAGARLYPQLGGSSMAEASVTVAVAYGAYLLAEQGFGASGVVAVVFAGLVTGSGAFVHMGPGNWPRVRGVWDQIGFWANAIILPLAATLVPGLLRDLEVDEVLLVGVIYVFALLARAWILFGVLPMLGRMRLAAPMSRPQKALVLWGGVRGGVTLVLALSIADMSVLGDDARVLAALAAAYAVATLMINASTLALATRLLGLDKLSPADLALRERIIAGSLDRVVRVVGELAKARDLEPAAIASVEEALGRQRAGMGEAAQGPARIPFGERLRLGLGIICGQEARLIRRAFEDGAIGPRATGALRLSAERIADAARIEGRDGYERAALTAASAPPAYRAAVFLHRNLTLDRPLRAQIELHFTKLLETDRVLRDLVHFAKETVAPMIGEDATANIVALLEARTRAVDTELEAISAQYPAYAFEMERMLITRSAIRRERQQYLKLFNDGVIGQELYQDLGRDLDIRERAVTRPPKLDLLLSPQDLIARVPIFAELTPAQRSFVARRLKTHFTVPGEIVLGRGQRGSEMYFVASGCLQAEGGTASAILKGGDFFGELALLRPYARRRSTVRSVTHCRLLVLTRRDFQRLARDDPSIEATIRQTVQRQLDQGYSRPTGPHGN
ncbi:cation:proton antiporter [Paralimibaculum aggregatum]|uniref:Cation:proton antiporter n=1 Tax=Paralimibaculum aggregatum TaxID=3036245 RepID=A0ABQ6LCA3_9RHOB|nr:cation:proton antiporter [Limibaculum sp. NKW23]GMG81015.1 cation:proton antiporter [Limibaculum sp. NKW23]